MQKPSRSLVAATFEKAKTYVFAVTQFRNAEAVGSSPISTNANYEGSVRSGVSVEGCCACEPLAVWELSTGGCADQFYRNKGIVMVELGGCPATYTDRQIATLVTLPILIVFGDHLDTSIGIPGLSRCKITQLVRVGNNGSGVNPGARSR